MLTKQWLIENNYKDVANLIDEVVEEWREQDKRTRRNWWEILAGNVEGKPRKVAGREFPGRAGVQRLSLTGRVAV